MKKKFAYWFLKNVEDIDRISTLIFWINAIITVVSIILACFYSAFFYIAALSFIIGTCACSFMLWSLGMSRDYINGYCKERK